MATASRQAVMDVLALVFSRSSLRNVVTGEELHKQADQVLGHDGVLELGPIWAVVASQADFEAKPALPAFLFLKTLERRLGWAVNLPDAASVLPPSEREMLAKLLPLKEVEVERAIDPGAALPRGKARATADRPTRRLDLVIPEPGALGESPGKSSETVEPVASVDTSGVSSRRIQGLVAGLVALLAMAALGYQISRWTGGRKDWETVAASEVGNLPVESARRFGARQLNVRLKSSWQSLSEEARRDQLSRALKGLHGRDVQVIAVEDDEGRLKATAQFTSDGSVKVRIY